MFRSQGKYGGRTTAKRSYRACFTAWNKTRAGLYAKFGGLRTGGCRAAHRAYASTYSENDAAVGLRAARLSGAKGQWAISARTSAAPAPRARSFPRAVSRVSGTMPQLVQG